MRRLGYRSTPLLLRTLLMALPWACAFPIAAPAQTASVNIVVEDLDHAAATKKTEVSYVKTGSRCEYRLEFNAPGTLRPIGEVAGDRGVPQRRTTPNCAAPAFDFTPTSGVKQYEEQTAYYWAKVARDYAVRSLWITPPGLPGAPQLATQGVQPNVLTSASMTTACYNVGDWASGCMRAWPHEGPKIHIRAGLDAAGHENVAARTVLHEYGHYAAGFVFGAMDAGGFAVPAFLGDDPKFGFQEALANIFATLVLHDDVQRDPGAGGARALALASDSEFGDGAGATTQWPPTSTNWYAMAGPLQEAFRQSLWGADATGTIDVNWRPDPASTNQPDSPAVANRVMSQAFVYALITNRGHRMDAMAIAILAWIGTYEPLRAPEIRRIFESHGFAAPLLGAQCVDHGQCASLRCDQRPGAGCVAQDGQAQGGAFCTQHQQCSSAHCSIPTGKITGTCTSTTKQLGDSCVTHLECASRLCDGQHGARCVAPDLQAPPGAFCTQHQQCSSAHCSVPTGKITGTCTSNTNQLGDFCVTHQECASGLCQQGVGCVAPNLQAPAGAFCTQHQQCASGLCILGPDRIRGTCTSTNRKLGDACQSHRECASQRCDGRPGAGCVAFDGQAQSGQVCTTHQQCRTGVCNVVSGAIKGTCR